MSDLDHTYARQRLANGDRFRIAVKRDFGRYGYWDATTRTNRRDGFVVVLGGCNIMPGACWFRTVADAMNGIKVFMETSNSDEFWERLS